MSMGEPGLSGSVNRQAQSPERWRVIGETVRILLAITVPVRKEEFFVLDDLVPVEFGMKDCCHSVGVKRNAGFDLE